MFDSILKIVENFNEHNISEARKQTLVPFINYIHLKKELGETIRLNFICTHNSRRSHLSQIWAQTLAFRFNIKDVFCYSGGTETTALYPMVAETLRQQGFQIQQLSEGLNPVYAIKYDANEAAIICFSKKYDDVFNPKDKFSAIMTCSHADEGCPLVSGAEVRFSMNYEDPKAYDGTDIQKEKYAACSLKIAEELFWVFKSIQ